MKPATVCWFKHTAQLTPWIIWWNAILQQQVRQRPCKITRVIQNMQTCRILKQCSLTSYATWKYTIIPWNDQKLQNNIRKNEVSHRRSITNISWFHRLVNTLTIFIQPCEKVAEMKCYVAHVVMHSCMHLSTNTANYPLPSAKTVDHIFLIAHSILDIGYCQMAIVTSGNMIPYLISEFTYTIMHTWPNIEWNLAVYTESLTLLSDLV
jgi:hypothetical protein